MDKTGIMIFTDSIGESFEIRHIVAISKRGYGEIHYETNDGTWFSKQEIMERGDSFIDNLEVGDIIVQSDKDFTTAKIYLFNVALKFEGQPEYDHSKYTMPVKPLPKGL